MTAHLVDIATGPQDPSWHATCRTCHWRGPDRTWPTEAEADGSDHLADTHNPETPRPAALTQPPTTGRYTGPNPTATEAASGTAVEAREAGPLRKGSAGAAVLDVYACTERAMTSYEASMLAAGDFHSRRRESTRLLERGYLEKTGTLPNPAPSGRRSVDAYRITGAGLAEARRLLR